MYEVKDEPYISSSMYHLVPLGLQRTRYRSSVLHVYLGTANAPHSPTLPRGPTIHHYIPERGVIVISHAQSHAPLCKLQNKGADVIRESTPQGTWIHFRLGRGKIMAATFLEPVKTDKGGTLVAWSLGSFPYFKSALQSPIARNRCSHAPLLPN